MVTRTEQNRKKSLWMLFQIPKLICLAGVQKPPMSALWKHLGASVLLPNEDFKAPILPVSHWK